MLDFIVNPNSRSGQGNELFAKLQPLLDEAGVEYSVSRTKYRGHAEALTGELCEAQLAEGAAAPRLAVLGGDGTLSEVVSGLPLDTNPILGYIPAGSGNDFSRGMDRIESPEKALGRIISPSGLRTIDAGELTFGTEKRKRRFLVSCGCGYDAAICHEVNHSRLKVFMNRLHLGKAAFGLIGLKQVFCYKKTSGTLVVDGKDPVRINNIAFISCHNLPYEGGGWPFAPDARPDDGYLNLSIYAPKHRLTFMRALLASKKHAQTDYEGIQLITCREAKLTLDTPLVTHTDGEIMGQFRDFEIRALPSCLQLLE